MAAAARQTTKGQCHSARASTIKMPHAKKLEWTSRFDITPNLNGKRRRATPSNNQSSGEESKHRARWAFSRPDYKY